MNSDEGVLIFAMFFVFGLIGFLFIQDAMAELIIVEISDEVGVISKDPKTNFYFSSILK